MSLIPLPVLDKSRINNYLPSTHFFGRTQIESKVRYTTNPNCIIMCDLAGRTTRSKSHTCKIRLIDHKKSQTRLKQEAETNNSNILATNESTNNC